VNPRAGLDGVAKKKKSHICLYRESKLGRPASSLVSALTEPSRLTDL